MAGSNVLNLHVSDLHRRSHSHPRARAPSNQSPQSMKLSKTGKPMAMAKMKMIGMCSHTTRSCSRARPPQLWKEHPITDRGTRQELSTAQSSMSLASAFNQDSAASSSGTAQKYILFSFSCGHTLEDEASLNWYKIRPFELLELHRVGAVVPLPRRSALAYAEPYFESPVRVCEGISNKQKARKGAGGVAATVGVRGITEDQHSAHALEWKNRWAIIREGMLNLCKDPTVSLCLCCSCRRGLLKCELKSTPSHRFPLASIVAVRGPEQVDLTSKTKPRVISIKFRMPNAKHGPPEWSPGYSDANYNAPWHPPDKGKRKHSKSSTWVVY